MELLYMTIQIKNEHIIYDDQAEEMSNLKLETVQLTQ